MAAFGQSDLPEIGNISDIKGKTKFYLVAGAQDRKQILREFNRGKNGLQLVNKPEDADFIVEYRELNNKEKHVLGDMTITSKINLRISFSSLIFFQIFV